MSRNADRLCVVVFSVSMVETLQTLHYDTQPDAANKSYDLYYDLFTRNPKREQMHVTESAFSNKCCAGMFFLGQCT